MDGSPLVFKELLKKSHWTMGYTQIMDDINYHHIQVFVPSTHPNDDPETQKENAEMTVYFNVSTSCSE